MPPAKIQAVNLSTLKSAGHTLACLTAYDYRTAQILDQSGVDLILVGDSLANTFLGLPETYQLNLEQMVYHTQAVARGVNRALLVVDMPFGSYQNCKKEAFRNAVSLLQAGAKAVKLEGATQQILRVIERFSEHGIPVIGHLGYTPQFAAVLGKGRIQGKTEEQAERIYHAAQALQEAGAVAVVLELLPAELAQRISGALTIPTIGIGSGPHCDGQILVSDDLLGKSAEQFRFVKRYAELDQTMQEAFGQYVQEVREGQFPPKT